MRKIATFLLSVCCVVSVLSNVSFGMEEKEKSLEKLFFMDVPVIIASGKNEKLKDAPANVYVITGAEMQKRGYRTLLELLKDLPGTTYLNISGYLTYGTPVIRGMLDVTRFKFLLNGQWIDPHSGFGTAWCERFPIAGIERVEFIIGPYASLYKRNSFSGVLNVVTKNGSELDGLQTNVLYGTWNQLQGDVVYGKKINTWDIYLSIFKNYMKEGWDITKDYTEYTKDYRQTKLTGTNSFTNSPADYYLPLDTNDLYLNVKNDNGLALDLNLNKGTWPKVGTGLIQTQYYQNKDTVVDDLLLNARTQYKKDLTDKLNSQTVVSYQSYDYEAMNGYLNNTAAYYKHQVSGYTLEENARYKVADKNEIFVGLSYEALNNKPLLMGVRTVSPGKPTLGSGYDEKYVTLTIQDEVKLSDKITTVVGMMYEKEDKFPDVIVPRLSLVWFASNKDIVKLLYGGGYLTPDPLKTCDQLSVKGNSSLKPEFLKSYEFNVLHTFTDKVHLAGSIFYEQMNDAINQITQSGLGFNYSSGVNFVSTWKNIGSKKSWGLELCPDMILSNKVKGFASYGYVDGKYDSISSTGEIATKDWLPASAKHHVKIGVNVLLLNDKVNLYVHDLYMGQRSQWATSDKMEGYNMVDLNIMTTDNVFKNLSFSLAVNNVLDRRAWDPPLRNAATSGLAPLPPRRITFQATKKW